MNILESKNAKISMNAIYNRFENITELKVKRDSLIKFIGKLEFRLFILCNSDLAIPRYL